MDLSGTIEQDDRHFVLNHDGVPIWREMSGKEHVGAVGKIQHPWA